MESPVMNWPLKSDVPVKSVLFCAMLLFDYTDSLLYACIIFVVIPNIYKILKSTLSHGSNSQR